MPSPSSTLTTIAPQLPSYMEARFPELAAQFVATSVLPITNVQKQSGTFAKIPIEEIIKASVDLRRAATATYWRDNTQFTEDSFATIEYGVEELIDDREAAMYSDFLDPYRFAIDRALHRLLIESEKRAAALVMDVTTYTGTAALNHAGVDEWNVATGVPVTDVNAAKEKFFTNTGLYPTSIVMNRKLFNAVRANPQVTAMIASTGAGSSIETGQITAQQIASCFDLDTVYVAGGAKNTAAASAAAALSHIWPDYAMLLRVASTNDMREPCVGRTMHWAEDGSRYGGAVEEYYAEDRRSRVIRVRHEMQEKRLHVEMGLLITGPAAGDLYT